MMGIEGILLLFAQTAIAVAPANDGIQSPSDSTTNACATAASAEPAGEQPKAPPGPQAAHVCNLVQVMDVESEVAFERAEVPEKIPVIYSDQSSRRRSATRGSAEAYVYKNEYDSGVLLSINYLPDTGLVFPGAMIADEMILGNGFDPSQDTISAYEILIFRDIRDLMNETTLADYTVELWDGDPFNVIDVTGDGYAGAPIASHTFTGVPGPGVYMLRAELDPPVTAPHQRVWMVLSGDQTCQTGWRLSSKVPEIGDIFRNDQDVFELQDDSDGQYYGAGHCCNDLGETCQVGTDPCQYPDSICDYLGLPTPCYDTSGYGTCTDLDAEDASTLSFGGPCDGGVADFCSSFAGNIYGPTDFTVTLQPRTASGPHVIVDNEIVMPAGGQNVWLDIWYHNWGVENPVKTWQAKIDSSGYTSGLEGELVPWNPPCTSDAECQAAHGHNLSGTCNDPSNPLGGCSPGFQDFSLDPDCPGYYKGCLKLDLPAVWIGIPDYIYGSTLIFSPEAVDNGVPHYAGTVVLEVSPDAKGTFTVDLVASVTWMKDRYNHYLPMIGHVPALIRVATGQCCDPSSYPPTCISDEVTAEECATLGGVFNLYKTCADTCLFMPTTPDGEAGYDKNRYISFLPGNPGELTALRVTLTTMPPEFAAHQGTQVWVGEPIEVCENSGQSTPPPEGCGPAWVPGGPALTMQSANLQATQYCHDFGSVGLMHVTDCQVVPSATYEVQAIDCATDPGNEANYSTPLTINTSMWGDICNTYDGTHWTAPNGTIDVTLDVTACLEKFKNAFGAPIKARADVDGNTPEWKVNVSTDVTRILDAFKGQPYPFAGPGSCP